MGRSRSKIVWYTLHVGEAGFVPRLLGELPHVDVWEPVEAVRRLVDGEWRDESAPLFPGYVLLGTARGWRHVERVADVRLLRCGSSDPVELSDADLETIRQAEARDRNEEPVFRAGQSVVIRESVGSPYAGMVGSFMCLLSVKGGKFAIVAIDLCGECGVIARIPVDHLEVV